MRINNFNFINLFIISSTTVKFYDYACLILYTQLSHRADKNAEGENAIK
jgi:hypothetical protein